MKKISFENLLDNMSYFLNFPEVESEIEEQILELAEQSVLSETKNGNRPAVDVLADYLKDDKGQNKLKMVIAMAGGSEEKLKRIVASVFDGAPINKIKTDAEIRRRVASFLVNPNNEPSFVPAFVRKSFALPRDWINSLKDMAYMSAVARNSMSATYSSKMGFQLEKKVGNIVNECGYSYEKGPVELVDNKEVDLAIPNITNPQIMVMVSYQLTTGSGQTTKANEQSQMYSSILSSNRSRVSRSLSQSATGIARTRFFVNVVDGGGWIARKNDLEQLWRNCDYCYTFNTIEDIRFLIKHIMKP